MKKILAVVFCVLLSIAFVSCSAPAPAASEAPAAASEAAPAASEAAPAPAASEAAPASEAPAASEPAAEAPAAGNIKVGFAIRTMDGSYYKAIADDTEKYAKELGWEIVVLNAADDIAKETENMQTLVSMGVNLIFLDCVDPTAAVESIKLATDAGIPLINLDSGVDEGTAQVTTVYSDNEQNGLKVGQIFVPYFDEKMGKDTEIKSILLSGNKGSIAGEQRRQGLMAGIIMGRTGCTEEEAWTAAKELDQQVISGGKGTNADAKFTIVGQGWGNWNENGGLEAVEDILTANPDANVIMGENDPMVLGAMAALDNAGKKAGEDIILISAADGSFAGYDAIKAGTYFAIGQNSPGKIAKLGVEIAKEILVDGKDPASYDAITMTDAIAVVQDNVEAEYEYGF